MSRKQHSEQVQDTSITDLAATARQQAATGNDAAFRSKKTDSAFLKKKNPLADNEEANTYAQNVSSDKHRNISYKIASKRSLIKRSIIYNRSNENDVYRSRSIETTNHHPGVKANMKLKKEKAMDFPFPQEYGQGYRLPENFPLKQV